MDYLFFELLDKYIDKLSNALTLAEVFNFNIKSTTYNVRQSNYVIDFRISC